MATAGKVIKCRAAVAWEPNAPLVIEEIEVGPPQEGEIRIKIVASSLCHTEIFHLFEGKDKRGFPTVLGHEGAGVVESVGPGVTDFKPGDKVIPVSVAQCGECRFCKSPKTNVCDRNWINYHVDLMSYPTTRFTCRGRPILQFTNTGTFSEYIVINRIYVVKIQDDAPLDRVCLLGCGISTGYGAAVNTAGVTPGSVCAVFGLGAVGLAAVMGCKNAGASRIFAVDINEQKFEKAKVFGATDFLNPKAYNKPISEVLAELTSGGVDFSLECVGNTEVSRAALESCIKGWGVSVLVGYTDVDFSARPIQLISGKTWKGTLLGGFKIKDSLPKLVNDYMTGKIMLDEFITHKMDLEQINDAINLMKTGQCIRCILNISK
ncbi:alcohol dehydrogenase 8b [Sinocyclocheilus anshuiensis]|uniref:Alcohol dehydrogenase 1-like n=1 Tax=Sinocyclocheilus anshuiensis TaxID=1608454 RepID=A0A671SKL3_9TELE|nr:PREDICTED: alcohol dehydrogenase 1-like [Sinocyclocheilus anshuiensis]